MRVYVVDPGDMNTQMHREAEPGVDLSRLPGPEVSAPAFVHLIEQRDGAVRPVRGPGARPTLTRALEPDLS